MEISGENFSFQWPDFRGNLISSFARLRRDSEFTDVTLVCEDGKQVDSHKLVLISSPFFLKVLTENKHPHPMIYMRGVSSENLLAMVDFLCTGEANVLLENYHSFLSLAEDLQLKGLSESFLAEIEPPSKKERVDETVEQAQNALPEDPADGRQSQMKPKQLGEFPDLEESALPEDPAPGRQNPMKVENQDGELRASSDLDILDQRVKSMMMFSTGPCAYGRRPGRARVCKVY